MNFDSEDNNLTPSEILEEAKAATLKLLPEKSRKQYELAYKAFMDWRKNRNVNSLSEDVLLVYFSQLSQKYKSSSLWSTYSILKSTLCIYHNVKLEYYSKLRAFLKRKSEGYQAKKSQTFTPQQIDKFINEAPDDKYLAIKVTHSHIHFSIFLCI